MSASRPAFIAENDEEVAAACFVWGALLALTPPREAYEFEGISGPGIGSFERALHCEREIGRIQREDRIATLERCLALAAAARPTLIAAE